MPLIQSCATTCSSRLHPPPPRLSGIFPFSYCTIHLKSQYIHKRAVGLVVGKAQHKYVVSGLIPMSLFFADKFTQFSTKVFMME
jgi:hypothetical protein